jgi:hypothetical protein
VFPSSVQQISDSATPLKVVRLEVRPALLAPVRCRVKKSFAFEENTSIVANRRTGLPVTRQVAPEVEGLKLEALRKTELDHSLESLARSWAHSQTGNKPSRCFTETAARLFQNWD